MWCLEYRTEKSSHDIINVSTLLLADKTYRLGRSSSTDFRLYNDGSISSQHLELEVNGEDGSLIVRIVGKKSKIGAKDIFRTAEPIVKVIRRTTKIELGSKGHFIVLNHKPLHLWIGKDVTYDYALLRSMGVIVSLDYTKATTHMVVLKSTQSTSLLEALIRQIPVLSQYYIEELAAKRDDLVEHYDDNELNELEWLVDDKFAPNPKRQELLKGHIFVFSDDDLYETMQDAVSAAGGHACLFPLDSAASAHEYVSFVESQSNNGLVPCLVQPRFCQSKDLTPAQMNKLALLQHGTKRLGRFLVSSRDILTAVIDASLSELVRTRPIRSETPEELPGPPHKKSRRGAKIRPLDSLDFFAGGGKTEATSQPQPLSQMKENVSYIEQQDISPKKKTRSRIKPLGNQMLDTNFTPLPSLEANLEVLSSMSDTQIKKTQTSGELQSKARTPTTRRVDAHMDDDIIADSEDDQGDVIVPMKSSVPKIPLIPPTSSKRQFEESTSFSTAVVKAKKRADERIKKELCSDLSLEEDFAVEHLRDLAIVEDNVVPIRQREDQSQETSHSQEWKPEWNHRKNFKVFVKSNVKGKHLPAQTGPSFMCLKEYVSFEEYDPTELRITTRDEMMLQAIQHGHTLEQPVVEQHHKSHMESPETMRQPTVVNPPRMPKLFVDSDESDDEDRFAFADDGHDGLDMPLRQAQQQRVPEFRRDLTLNPAKPPREGVFATEDKEEQDASVATKQGYLQRASSKGGAPSRHVTKIPSRGRVDAEDDSDSDDEDRFRF